MAENLSPEGVILTPYIPDSELRVTSTESLGPRGEPSRLTRDPGGNWTSANRVRDPSLWRSERATWRALDT
ncbi:MAG: hypothetical protein KatS3mg081_1873 [Gemmatimonadales bacterium]|nr:MAG: hypothetical protein KatS3mg081_1873 [Gemmatimonadales bacterium]